jgi:hypothetical protein
MSETPRIVNVKSEIVEIGRLVPHPRNANQGDYGAIETSIKANGFYGSLTVQIGTCHILAGNHRYRVAKKLGFDALPVDWVDVDDATALRIVLVDNRSNRLGNDDPNSLADILTELARSENGLLGTGYDGDYVDDLLRDLGRPLDLSALGTPPTPPDRMEKGKPPRVPSEADQDRDKPGSDIPDDSHQEKTRLGVVVICDSEGDQDHIYHKLVDLGWCPSKTKFSEQSYTRLRSEQP